MAPLTPARICEQRFLEELDRRLALDPDVLVSPMEVGEALGFDPLEVANYLTWLFSKGLVRLRSDGLADPYTDEPLKVTRLGVHYLRTEALGEPG